MYLTTSIHVHSSMAVFSPVQCSQGLVAFTSVLSRQYMYSPTPVIRTSVIRTSVIRTSVIRIPVIHTSVIRNLDYPKAVPNVELF